MRQTYAIVGAIILFFIAAGVLFGTDFLGMNLFRPSPAQLMTTINEARVGGYAATFSEADSRKWQLSGGHRLERFALDEQGGIFARLSSSVPLDQKSVDWHSLGLSTTLTIDFNNQTAGKVIEVGFAARSSQSNGSDEASIVYATGQAGNSGWKHFKLDGSFALYKFTFQVPRPAEGKYINNPVIVLTSDTHGLGRAVELLGVYVKPVQ